MVRTDKSSLLPTSKTTRIEKEVTTAQKTVEEFCPFRSITSNLLQASGRRQAGCRGYKI